MNYEGLRLKCPLCHTKDWNETTAEFDPEVSPTGGMVRLVAKKRKAGMIRGFTNSAKHYQIVCGLCGASLIKAKKLTLADGLPLTPEQEEERALEEATRPVEPAPPPPPPPPPPPADPEPTLQEASEDEKVYERVYRFRMETVADWPTTFKLVPSPYANYLVMSRRMKAVAKKRGEKI
jgi:hypothetical protein